MEDKVVCLKQKDDLAESSDALDYSCGNSSFQRGHHQELCNAQLDALQLIYRRVYACNISLPISTCPSGTEKCFSSASFNSDRILRFRFRVYEK